MYNYIQIKLPLRKQFKVKTLTSVSAPAWNISREMRIQLTVETEAKSL